jgi:putative restriction endonuclease
MRTESRGVGISASLFRPRSSVLRYNIQLRLFERGGAVYTTEDVKDQDKTFVRNAAFRRIVVSLYQQNCAFCRLKIVSRDSQDIVDGAHIKPFAEFHDDRFL